jgi:hypothetical protein
MMAMSDPDFMSVCHFVMESGLADMDAISADQVRKAVAGPPPTQPIRVPVRAASVSGEIRNAQNEEYERCEAMARMAEIEAEKEAAQAEMRRQAAERQKLEAEKMREQEAFNYRDSLKKRAQNLPPEAADGIQIAIMMPSKKRIMRKFLKDQSCDDLFTLVDAEDEMFGESCGLRTYRLSQGPSFLEKGRTFEEQGILRRTMINVILD